MNAVLIGYGKMGREIEKILLSRGHRVVMVIDESNSADLTEGNLRDKNAEVAIEFTTPATALKNIMTCVRAGVAVVSGTTGWLADLDKVTALCRERGGAFFYASNYSIGVNVFFRLNEVLSSIMEPLGQYDVTVEEVHHANKKDAPSGTAITIAEKIVENLSRKREWVGTTTIIPDELEVLSVRRSTVPGTHTVTYESDVDLISLTHQAKSRTGFAEGAVMAAEFILGKKGVFSMKDILGF